MRKFCMLIASFLLLGTVIAQSQNGLITGTVTSAEDGEPVIGASVVVKGTTIGTATDIDGKYSLSVPQNASILVFSFIGMKDKEVEIAGRKTIDATLEYDALTLDEIVVTGLGVATDRRKVAISVESVSEEQLTRVPSNSVDGALVGRIAGAQIQSTSGQPGQQANIILRGINTLNTTQPMILIDGIEINTSNNDIGVGNVSSRLADLDLSNIERVEVVQGAAAATIYGAQGANGVIQIFTKRGRKGQKTDIRFNSNFSFNNALRGNLKFANYHHYATDAEGYIVDDLGVRSAPDPNTGFWNLPAHGSGANIVNNKPFVNKTYNHMDQYFVENAATIRNSLNITGATENIDYSLGFSQLSQESVVHGDLNRYNITANVGSEIFKNFTIRSSTQLITSENTTGGINNVNNIGSGIASALNIPCYVDLTWEDANGHPAVIYDATSNSINPFYSYMYRDDQANVNRVIQGIVANYKIGKHIDIDYKYGIDHYRYDYTSFIKNQTGTPFPGYGITPINGEITKTSVQETQQNSILSAVAKFDFQQDFSINLPIQSTTQIAYDWRRNDFHEMEAVGSGIDIDPPHTLNFAATTTATEDITKFITFGYLVNQKFDYGNMGGFSVGFRSDYSSEFGEGSKPFTFPRADAYFRLTEVMDTDYLYELKLRAAYGEAGIQPEAYSRLITLTSGTLGNATYMYLPAISRNPLLSVENTKEFEVGLDYGVNLSNSNWFSKIYGSLVYWTRNSYGTIYEIDVAPSTGAAGLLTNAIDLKSNGIQLSLDLDVVNTNSFDWKFGTRFSKGLTMVDRIANGLPIILGMGGEGQTSIIEGEPVGALFGLEPLSSLDQTNSSGDRYIDEADLANYEVVEGMVVDINTKQVQFTTEQVKIGDATPKFSMSFFNDFKLKKNLSVSMQLDWVHGAQAYNQTRQWLYRDKLHSDFDKEVTINGETGAYVAFWQSLYKTNMTNSYFIEDASFLRLRNLSVSYDISKHINSSFVKGFIITVSGQNLFTLSNYSGLDPEATGTSLNNPLERGIDLWSFPNMRTISFGLNLNF